MIIARDYSMMLSIRPPCAKIIRMNWNMLGHEWAVDLLKEHVARQEVRHAYLFTGPQGVGRRTLALRLAQALNCLQPSAPGEACYACRICVQTEKMHQPDLAVVQSEQVGGTLKVEQIRELQHDLALHPYEARYRVAVLLRFEEATPSAMNALLKTLEEPGPQVIIVLTAESAERLLPTIVSRCEILRLKPLPLEVVDQGLKNLWGVPAEKSGLLAHLSGGRPGYALRLHQDPQQLEQRHIWLDEHQNLLSQNRGERFEYAEALARDKDVLRGALLVWSSLWRDVLLKAAGSSTPITNLDRNEEIEELASLIGLHSAHQVVSALQRSLEQLDQNVNPRLLTEVLMLDLPST
jgi:DNA polymerase-3 subunit delta'